MARGRQALWRPASGMAADASPLVGERERTNRSSRRSRRRRCRRRRCRRHRMRYDIVRSGT